MAYMGIGELLVLFGLMGGAFGGTTADLEAPRDQPSKSLAWVLPEADIAAHVNIEGSVGAITDMMDEVSKLRIITDSPEFTQAMQQAKVMMDQTFEQGSKEVGLDFRKDAGSVTFSMALNDDQTFKLLLRARGNFGKSRIKELATQEIAHTAPYKKHTLYVLPDDRESSNNVLCLADDTTILLGDRTAVEAILDGRKLKAAKNSAAARLKKFVDRKSASYVYLALPKWVSGELRHQRDLALVADLLDATDYLLYVAGPKKASLAIQANNATASSRYEYMLKGMAAVVGIMEPAMDAVIYGALGFVPLVADHELDREVKELVSNEKGMLELGKWAKKRFGGKAKVKADRRKYLITMELSNPMSIGGITMPMIAGAAFYSFAQPFGGQEVPEKHKKDPIMAPPEPEPVPADDKTNIESGIK